MKFIFLILFLPELCLHVSAQISKGAKDSAVLEIRRLTDQWNKAVKDRDSVTLENLLVSMDKQPKAKAYSFGKRPMTGIQPLMQNIRLTIFGSSVTGAGRFY